MKWFGPSLTSLGTHPHHGGTTQPAKGTGEELETSFIAIGHLRGRHLLGSLSLFWSWRSVTEAALGKKKLFGPVGEAAGRTQVKQDSREELRSPPGFGGTQKESKLAW